MTRIIGHRGARDLWPENSMTGFRNVRSLPIEAVEFDVHLSDAGELLIMHDATLDRTTDASGPTRALTPERRAHVKLKDTGEGIPLLDEVLAHFAPTELTVHVEIKTDGDGVPYAGLEARVVEAIKQHGLGQRCRITCFNPDVLRECRRLAPDFPLIYAVNAKLVERMGFDAAFDHALEVADYAPVQMGYLGPNWDRIRAKVPLHRLGAWVPNTREDLREWLSKGLVQITTDRPDLAVEVRNELAAAGAA